MIFDSIITLIAGCCFIFGVAIGLVFAESSWRDDCEALGMHRQGQVVFECRKK